MSGKVNVHPLSSPNDRHGSNRLLSTSRIRLVPYCPSAVRSRVHCAGDLEANVSTFAAEMREMAFILHNIEPRSMVIVGELVSGPAQPTASQCHRHCRSPDRKPLLVWFVTHLPRPSRGPKRTQRRSQPAPRRRSIPLHLRLQMTMLYKTAEGPVADQFYGPALAKLVDLPPDILEIAQRAPWRPGHARPESTQLVEWFAYIAKKRNLILRYGSSSSRRWHASADALW